MKLAGEYPDVVLGCHGGGSNFAGLAFPFVADRAAGKAVRVRRRASRRAARRLTKGDYAYDYGDTAKLAPIMKMYTLGHDFMPPGIHAGGLRYHGASPLVSQLLAAGQIEARAYRARRPASRRRCTFARTEGIVPAPESSHAIRGGDRRGGRAPGRRGRSASSSSACPVTASSTWPPTTPISPVISRTSRTPRRRSAPRWRDFRRSTSRFEGEDDMRRLGSIAALAVLCASPAAAQDVVRLGNLKFAHYGAVSYMKELGPKYGLRVEERVFPKGIDILPAIVAGEIDIAASAADGAIAGRAAGAQVFAVAGFAKGGIRIVGRKDLGLTSVAQLKGKKVGVPRGGAQELALFAELAKAGLTWSDQPGKDVLVVYLAYADLNQTLMQKQIDAMCQSEPQSAQAIAKGIGTEIVKPYDTPMGEPVRVMVMTEKLYREKPDVALRVMKCFVAATQKFLADPALAQKYVREQLFKGQIIAAEYQDAMSNASFTYDLTVEHIQVTTDLMVKYGVGKLRNPPKAVDWVKLDLLEKAKQELAAR